MPTECERSGTSPEAQPQQLPANLEDQTQQIQQQTSPLSLQLGDTNDIMDTDKTMDINGEMSTSQTSNTSSNGGPNGSCNGAGRKSSLISPDPTAYVAKARVTRPTPPPPSYNPMQFVQIKPCNLYQTAQQQLKKAEEVKKIKEIKKEEPEDWQCNLDNWKSSRRKRVEHIIDRVVEVKKLELEEHDRSRRKSKTFSEMIEEKERGERGRIRTKLASLAVYNEDESNDLSDLGIGTSSASGKSSQSEDYDNNSVMSDNADLEKAIYDNNHKANTSATNGCTREYISSPGYDTSSSTAPASSPDPCEYTYEGAIQDYKQRVSRATSVNAAGAPLNGGFKLANGSHGSKESTPERGQSTANDGYPTRRGSKIEDRLIGFEVSSPSDNQEGAEKNKIAVDVPKIDISKRKEIFETQRAPVDAKPSGTPSAVPKVTLRERFKFVTPQEGDVSQDRAKKEVKRMSGDITSIRERLQSLEQQQNLVNSGKPHVVAACMPATVDMPPVAPLKDRLSSLQSAVTKEAERKPPVSLIDARQLEIMKNEEETAQQRLKQMAAVKATSKVEVSAKDTPAVEKDNRDDSGIHIEGDTDLDQQRSQLLQQEDQLNAAIAALAMEEQQLEAAANAVNQIEAEFAELSATNSVLMPALASGPAEPSDPMEFSVSPTNISLSGSGGSPSGSRGNGGSISSDPRPPLGSLSGSSSSEVVGGGTTKSALRRKPSNEMVHAKNLLKMFSETFKNDIELDEEPEDDTLSLGSSVVTVIEMPPSPTKIEPQTPSNPVATPPCQPPPSMIPRTVNALIGKPPMSPKAPRRLPPPSPVASPMAGRKADNQFSINGRVEIFNSKTMAGETPNKPPTPTATKKPYLPQIPGDNSAMPLLKDEGEHLKLHPQQQQRHEHETSTISSAMVSEPSSPESKSMPPFPSPTEIVVCAPPVTIVNPDELPKPNTVKALTSCFAHHDNRPVTPKPLPRSRIPLQTPPQSPTPAKRNFPHATADANDDTKKLSIISNASSDSAGPPSGPIVTRAVVHTPPAPRPILTKEPLVPVNDDPLKPNACISPKVAVPSEKPTLVSCAANESSLFKMVSSTPSSPKSPHKITAADIELFTNFLQGAPLPSPNKAPIYLAQPEPFETPCTRVDVSGLPDHKQLPCTSYQDIEKPLANPTKSHHQMRSVPEFGRQTTVEEMPCDKVDVSQLPRHKQVPCTIYANITPAELNSPRPLSKPNSPIVAARAAHSKALIDTCEKIIAEEKLASGQMKSSLPSSPKATPILQRKSKIPKPIPMCCIGSGSNSVTSADYEKIPQVEQQPCADTDNAAKADDNLLIARLHVVETQIKVTTSTPPSSPKPTQKVAPSPKKTKNIFDFLKRNFGHHDEPHAEQAEILPAKSASGDSAANPGKADEIITVDNSKFYVASDEVVPPPLPKTPAPVNIEIKKTITTDEIVEDGNSELAFSQEINELLDDELNKLSLDSGDGKGAH